MSKLSPDVSAADHVAGRNDAPITLVEFGDFQCPSCGEAFPMLKEIQKAMGDDLRFVFRHFPLKTHPHAMGAAMAVEAAGKQGKFWEMHDLCFENQDALAPQDLADYADDLGLNLKKFEVDFENQKTRAKVLADLESGEKSGVAGTPSFYINGIKFEGAYEKDAIMKFLEQFETDRLG